MDPVLSTCSCSRWTLTPVVVILSKHLWHPGYCNTMHICFEWCNELYGQANIRRCHLQSHKVYVSYLRHLSQTAEPTHADIAVGKRWSVLSRNLTEPRLVLQKRSRCVFPILCLLWPGSACVSEACDGFSMQRDWCSAAWCTPWKKFLKKSEEKKK